MRPRSSLAVVPLALLLSADAAAAHDFAFTDVRLDLRPDGNWVADVRCDVDALALGVSSSADSEALAAERCSSPPEAPALERAAPAR